MNEPRGILVPALALAVAIASLVMAQEGEEKPEGGSDSAMDARTAIESWAREASEKEGFSRRITLHQFAIAPGARATLPLHLLEGLDYALTVAAGEMVAVRLLDGKGTVVASPEERKNRLREFRVRPARCGAFFLEFTREESAREAPASPVWTGYLYR